jgi:hypothetical protein
MAYPYDPPYTWRPIAPAPEPQTPLKDAPQSIAPSYAMRRARLLAGGTFYRSRYAGKETNKIAVELRVVDDNGNIVPEETKAQKSLLIVYFDDVEVERFGPVDTESTGGLLVGNAVIKTTHKRYAVLINGVSEYIEMPNVDYGGVLVFGDEDPLWRRVMVGDALNPQEPNTTNGGIAKVFPKTLLTEGDGPPDISTIYTGPERLIVIETMSELVNNDVTDQGIMTEVPQDKKLKQYDGTVFIPYVPNTD